MRRPREDALDRLIEVIVVAEIAAHTVRNGFSFFYGVFVNDAWRRTRDKRRNK